MTFDLAAFLEEAGVGRTLVHLQPMQAFFSQEVRLTLSTIFGRAAQNSPSFRKMAKKPRSRCSPLGNSLERSRWRAWAGCIWPLPLPLRICTALKIARGEMIRVMHEEHAFSEMFLKFLLTRSMRTQADLVDQLFNSSEKRLARILC